MGAIPAIAIVDVGKTNKKLMVYDSSYNLIHQQIKTIPETVDEDGFPSEDLSLLCNVVLELIDEVLANPQFDIQAINFTAYGASFVYLDKAGNPLPPLYNYLKPYPEEVGNEFFANYGKPEIIALETASPTLGNLNSGMQLYWLKKQKPDFFNKIHTALHLPQFISYLISHKTYVEKTSIGCHTQLWNFKLDQYHEWVEKEKLNNLFPALIDSASSNVIIRKEKKLQVGVGLHDSSSALVPYTTFLRDPFILISTGTWSISLNPFNQEPLCIDELKQDCLCYFQSNGKAVKASRLFLGHFHDTGTSKIASHYALPRDFFAAIKFDNEVYQLSLKIFHDKQYLDFDQVDLMEIGSPDVSYYLLIAILVKMQVKSTSLIFGKDEPETILVDGGFSQNELFLRILKQQFSSKRLFVSMLSQSTSLGAALILHDAWNQTKLSETVFPLMEIQPS
ncbi:MAG: hypothetical protein RL131_1488 [Bacteroidota bacterium]